MDTAGPLQILSYFQHKIFQNVSNVKTDMRVTTGFLRTLQH